MSNVNKIRAFLREKRKRASAEETKDFNKGARLLGADRRAARLAAE